MKNIIDSIELDHEKIDEVYNGLKNEWVNDIDKSELDFIKNQMSFMFSENDVYDKEVVDLEYNRKSKLYEYLQRKLDGVKWTDNDHYNYYLQTKKFDNPMLHEYNHRQFESISKLLKDYERRYFYIITRLSNDDEIELKNDWIDHLEKLKGFQSGTKYKEIISNVIETINKKEQDCLQHVALEQIGMSKSDMGVFRHPKIFDNNAFCVWESMFDSFQVTEKKRTDLRFMFEAMKYDNLIHNTVTVANIVEWINETYQIKVEKLHYTDIKSRANNTRMAIYKIAKQAI